MEVKRDAMEIQEFLKRDLKDEMIVKVIKYNLIEIAEASANVLQHILARDKAIASGGYMQTLEKAKEEKIISSFVYEGLKPFFKFRNALIHRYWQIEDKFLMKEVKTNHKVFYKFTEEIEKYLSKN